MHFNRHLFGSGSAGLDDVKFFYFFVDKWIDLVLLRCKRCRKRLRQRLKYPFQEAQSYDLVFIRRL